MAFSQRKKELFNYYLNIIFYLITTIDGKKFKLLFMTVIFSTYIKLIRRRP